MSATDEALLVQRLQRGDTAALREVYGRYADRLFRFLARLAGRTDVAEDLHQETWIAASRYAARLTADTDLAAWLFTIARNKYRSWRRWSVLELVRLQPREALPEAVATGGPDVDERRDLERALAALPTTHREVLLLIGCEGLATDEVAGILGLTDAAVRQRLSRARAALAEALAREGRRQAVSLRKEVV